MSASTQNNAKNWKGPLPFGHFTLDRKLAEGGMAEVFLARQRGIGGFEKQIVVKRILPALASHADFVEMFLNEARLAARLSHSNVVQVIESGDVDGQYYIAMEFIDGCDLKTFYDEAENTKQPMPPGVACRVIADLLAGLHYAHTVSDEKGRPLGLVHRDVSPQNVLITKSGNVKIVDFGIAKATHAAAQQTRAGQVKGKVSYLSPEQAMGRSLDARSDVFACGILLWELVTGQRLFMRPSDMATIIAITDENAPTARSVRPELPESLDIVLGQALARQLTDRYPSAQMMQTELEQLIRSEGWAGDRRTLERYVLQRVGEPTPHAGLPAIAEDYGDGAATVMGLPPGFGMPERSAPTAPTLRGNVPVPVIHAPSFNQAPTMPVSRDQVNAALAFAQQQAQQRQAPPPQPAPLVAPMPQPQPYRTPSEMHAMPPSQGSGLIRRIAVIGTAAGLATLAAVVAINWHSDTTEGPTVQTLANARVAVEVSEPAVIEIDGHKARVTSAAEMPLSIGRQTTLTATTVRGNGHEVTRTIALPPAQEGERIPVKISFP